MIDFKQIEIKKIISWSAVIIWMAVIFMLSHQPAARSNELSKGVAEIIIETIEKIAPDAGIEAAEINNTVRKHAHFFAYLILGILLMNAFSRRDKSRISFDIKASLAVSIIYAISDEIHQIFIPGRGAQITDVLIDSAGAILGILIYALIRLLAFRHKTKKISGGAHG